MSWENIIKEDKTVSTTLLEEIIEELGKSMDKRSEVFSDIRMDNPKLLFKLVREQARAIQYAYMELEELKTGGKGKKKITPTNSPKGKGLFDFPNA